MNNCADAESFYKDIPFCPGKKEIPGLRQYVYGISKRDVVKFPTIPSDAVVSPDMLAKYSGEFLLTADKKWHRVGTIDSEGQLQVESQGNFGSKTFKVTLTFLIPGTGEAATGYIAEANNDDMLYLVPRRDGKFRLVGNEAFTAELSLSQDSGKVATDTNATTVQAVVTDMYPAPYYPGKIETTDGDISGETGQPITVGG